MEKEKRKEQKQNNCSKCRCHYECKARRDYQKQRLWTCTVKKSCIETFSNTCYGTNKPKESTIKTWNWWFFLQMPNWSHCVFLEITFCDQWLGGLFHIQHQRQRLLSQMAMAGLWPAVSINPASHTAPHYHYLSNILMAVQASGQLYQPCFTHCTSLSLLIKHTNGRAGLWPAVSTLLHTLHLTITTYQTS